MRLLNLTADLVSLAFFTSPSLADERSAREYYTRAEAALKLHDYRGASEHAKRAEVELGSSNALLQSVFLREAFARGDFARAAQHADRFLAFSPNATLRERFGELAEEARFQNTLRERGKGRFETLAVKKDLRIYGSPLIADEDVIVSAQRKLKREPGRTYHRLLPDGRMQWLGWISSHKGSSPHFEVAASDGTLVRLNKPGGWKKPHSVTKYREGAKKVWSRELPNSKYAKSHSLTPLSDGGFLAAYRKRMDGHKNRHEKDISLVRLTSSGKVIWERKYQLPEGVTSSYVSIVPRQDNGYTIFGTREREDYRTAEPRVRQDFDASGKLLNHLRESEPSCSNAKLFRTDLSAVCWSSRRISRTGIEKGVERSFLSLVDANGQVSAAGELPVPWRFENKLFGPYLMSNGHLVAVMEYSSYQKDVERDRTRQIGLVEYSADLKLRSITDIGGYGDRLDHVLFSNDDFLALEINRNKKDEVHLIGYMAGDRDYSKTR